MKKKTEGLTLGEAMTALKAGSEVSRKAWDIGRYLEYKSKGVQKDLQVGVPNNYGPCVVLWVSYRRYIFWIPCHDDLFAEDWFIVR